MQSADGATDAMIGIDHVVIAVDNPDVAADALEASLGLRAEGGGRHDALGTANRLVWLGDTYLELAAVVDPVVAERSWFGRLLVESLASGGGFATWAIAVGDLEAHLRWLAGGVELTGPRDGERRRPD